MSNKLIQQQKQQQKIENLLTQLPQSKALTIREIRSEGYLKNLQTEAYEPLI
ncbi:hypothetical protein [Allofrancisella frigidaquae]|uniref:hypothetical protein n=1 Tax=Allofrancisella frigidaquae TaxID=1085644 RepID=UPI001556C67F|nr:hypothetical protein [Allofrancisella frigidaquae]